MSGNFNLDDYVDVAARISEFSEKYPEGSLQAHMEFLTEPIGWFCVARAYRTADDERPGIGHAFEPVPGKTQFTRDSEAQNAETAAWGRAIVALGFKTKKIASRQEVQARQGSGEKPVSTDVQGGRPTGGASSAHSGTPDPHGLQASHAGAGVGDATDKQKGMIRRLEKKLGRDAVNVDVLSKSEASALIEQLLALEEAGSVPASPPGGADLDVDIPFGPVIA